MRFIVSYLQEPYTVFPAPRSLHLVPCFDIRQASRAPIDVTAKIQRPIVVFTLKLYRPDDALLIPDYKVKPKWHLISRIGYRVLFLETYFGCFKCPANLCVSVRTSAFLTSRAAQVNRGLLQKGTVIHTCDLNVVFHSHVSRMRIVVLVAMY